jgi:hypothetical protein
MVLLQEIVTIDSAQATARARTGTASATSAGWAGTARNGTKPFSSACRIVPATEDLTPNTENAIVRPSGPEETATSVS